MKAIKINKFIFSIVFKRLFNKGNRKHFFRVSIEFIETLVGARVPTQFLVSPKLSRVFLYKLYSHTTRKMFSIS